MGDVKYKTNSKMSKSTVYVSFKKARVPTFMRESQDCKEKPWLEWSVKTVSMCQCWAAGKKWENVLTQPGRSLLRPYRGRTANIPAREWKPGMGRRPPKSVTSELLRTAGAEGSRGG